MTYIFGPVGFILGTPLYTPLLQVQVTPDDYKKFQRRPQALIAKFIKAQLGT